VADRQRGPGARALQLIPGVFAGHADESEGPQAMFGSGRSAVRAANQQLIGKNPQLMSFSGNSATTSPPCLACLWPNRLALGERLCSSLHQEPPGDRE
jgi:hypothetical protein